jgi:hypothetical protein
VKFGVVVEIRVGREVGGMEVEDVDGVRRVRERVVGWTVWGR